MLACFSVGKNDFGEPALILPNWLVSDRQLARQNFCQSVYDITKYVKGRLGSVDIGHQIFGVKAQSLVGLIVISIQTLANDFIVGVVQTILFQGSRLETIFCLVGIFNIEVENLENVQSFRQGLGLIEIPWKSVKDQHVLFWKDV